MTLYNRSQILACATPPPASAPGPVGTDFGASLGTAHAPAQGDNADGIGGWLESAGSILASGTGRSGSGDSIVEALAKSAARSIGSQIGREIVRGVLGSLLGSGKRR